MNQRQKWRPIAVIAAIPAGVFGGYYLGMLLFLGILRLQGLGSSHGDLTTIAVGGILGAASGAITLPIAVWLLLRDRRK
jgi:hypothetical protein